MDSTTGIWLTLAGIILLATMGYSAILDTDDKPEDHIQNVLTPFCNYEYGVGIFYHVQGKGKYAYAISVRMTDLEYEENCQ